MTMTDTIRLISSKRVRDPDGYWTDVETAEEVFCDSGKGVTRAEFWEARRSDVKMSAAFELWACDYGGQTVVEHNGTRYKVERAYPLGDGSIQLNCSEAVRDEYRQNN